MTVQSLTGIMISIVSVLTLLVTVYWHLLTRGECVHYPHDRVVMALLGTQTAITALAAASSFFPSFPGRPVVYVLPYLLLIFAVAGIGWVIRPQDGSNPD